MSRLRIFIPDFGDPIGYHTSTDETRIDTSTKGGDKLKENYTDDKYFNIMYRSNYGTHFVGFIKKKVVFVKKSNKIDFPHHAIINIAPCAERADRIAKPAQ